MMKPSKVFHAALLLALSLCALPDAGWSTRLLGKVVSGQVTATPASGQIEVDHQAYRIRAGTSAEKNLRNFHMGQVVDLELDGPSVTKNAQVVSIALHTVNRGAHD